MFRLCRKAVIRNRLTKYRTVGKKVFLRNITAYANCTGNVCSEEIICLYKTREFPLPPPQYSPSLKPQAIWILSHKITFFFYMINIFPLPIPVSPRGSCPIRISERTVFAIRAIPPLTQCWTDTCWNFMWRLKLVAILYLCISVKDISEILPCKVLRILYLGPFGVIRKINMYTT